MTQKDTDSERGDDRLAFYVATGRSATAAAKAAGVSRATVVRRQRDERFRRRVAEIRADMLSRAAGRLVTTMTAAAESLRTLLGHDDPNVRRLSAVAILAHGVKLAEIVDLERRLADLEQQTMKSRGTNDGVKHWQPQAG